MQKLTTLFLTHAALFLSLAFVLALAAAVVVTSDTAGSSTDLAGPPGGLILGKRQ